MGWIPPSLEVEDFLDTSCGVRQPTSVLSDGASIMDSDTEDSDAAEDDGEAYLKWKRQSSKVRKLYCIGVNINHTRSDHL